MNFRNLFDDDEAVSPVIGVILMVAITVILAAVIGTFVLGQADQLNENAPTTDFDYELQDDGTYNVIHAGGDDFTAETVDVDGQQWDTVATGTVAATDTVTAGGIANIASPGAGQTIRVTWEAAGGGSSSTIGQYTVPE